MSAITEIFIKEKITKLNTRDRPFNKNDTIRATGDWVVDAGGDHNWASNECLGLMEFNPCLRIYTKRIHDLKQNHRYRWKVTINNTWNENYGAYGRDSHEAVFLSNSFGAVRILLIPHLVDLKLHFDHYVIDWSCCPKTVISKATYQINDEPSSTRDPKTVNGHHVFVHLFEWKWNDIADECESFLAPKGYGAIQVSPPNEHAIFPDSPWWQRYQPVSYKLDSRSGTEQEFIRMVQRCNNLGVRIYVDAVINHMSASIGYGSAGTYFNYKTLEYPGVPFKNEDFNDSFSHTQSGNIESYYDVVQVRNCRLSGLPDLATGRIEVRQKIVEYLNKLIEIGVAGFRIDASKHMWPEDINMIVDSLNDLRADLFGRNKRPFIYQEVIDLGGEPIDYNDYVPIGRVTEFRYGMHLSHVVDRRYGQKLCYLRNFGWNWGFLNDIDAVAFIDNHDNQRGHGGGGLILNFFRGRYYKIANAFMLAWPYGCVQVMSSYNFHKKDHSQGPPSNKNGHTLDVQINKDGSCTNGWMCEHRWKQIANMVEFRNISGEEPVTNWWDNCSNQIAFSRGNKAFIAINNDDFNMREELQTNLECGIYRDIISENRLVYVKSDGTALIDIKYYTDDPLIAIHTNSKLN